MTKELGEVLILVADDDRDFGDVVRHILKDNGYRAIACGNGAEAIAMSKKLNPDLILSTGNTRMWTLTCNRLFLPRRF